MRLILTLFSLVLVTELAFGQAVRDIETGVLSLKQQGSAPSSPASGKFKAYVRDSKLRLKDSSGNESTVGTGAGAENLLTSGNMEDGLAAWTLTAGTKAEETTIKIEGLKSAKVTLTSQALEFYQSSTTHQAQFADGVQGIARVRIKTSVAGVFLCSSQAGLIQYSNCAAHSGSGKWELLKVPFVLGGTSNGLAVISGTMSGDVVTPGNVTGDVYIDDAHLGTDAGIADVSVITPWQSYTPTFTGLGSVASHNFRWRQSGSNIDILGRVVIGTPTATEMRITLPGGFTAYSGITNVELVGRGARNNTTNANNDYNVLAQPSTPHLTFQIVNNTGSDALAPANANSIISTGNTFQFFASVPVNELSGSTQVFASQCGARCENHLTATVGSTGTLSKVTPPGWVTSGSVSSGRATIVSTGFTVVPNCGCNRNDGDGECTYRQSLSTTTSLVFDAENSAGTANASEINIWCDKSGADYQSSRTIIGSFKEVVTAPGISKPKVCKFYYSGAANDTTSCTSSPCTEREDTCGVVSACTRSGTGQYACVIAAGTFAPSSRIDCRAMTNTFDLRLLPLITDGSGGLTVDIFSASSGAVNTDSYGRVTCEGSAP